MTATTNPTAAPALRDFPAFRLVHGDVIRHDGRRHVVLATCPVVLYPRNRNVGAVAAGLRARIRPERGGRTTDLVLRNDDTVRCYR